MIPLAELAAHALNLRPACMGEEMLSFVDSPYLCTNMDAGNTFIAGHDPVAFLERFAGKVNHVHIKDVSQSLATATRGDLTGIAASQCAIGGGANAESIFSLDTAGAALRLCREIGHPSVGVLLDTFHANVEEKDIPAALRSLGPALYHVHLSENDRGIPGTSHVPFRAVFEALSDMDYTGAAVVESFATTIPEIAGAAAVWRDLYPSSDRFATESMAFLRGLRSLSQAG